MTAIGDPHKSEAWAFKDQGRFHRAVLTPSGATADLLNVASHLAGVRAIEDEFNHIMHSAYFCQAASEALLRATEC